MGCLRGYRVKGKLLPMLQALYLENSMEVNIGDKQSGCFSVSSGLRKGCVLSPLLFPLYIHQWLNCGVETERVCD